MENPNILNISPKKQQIFSALTSFILDGKSPESITVSAIAAKAGIGKGTVYEYFSCKEDIYKEATLYYSSIQLTKVKQLMAECTDGFKSTFMTISDFILSHSKESSIFMEFIVKALDLNRIQGEQNLLCDIGKTISSQFGDEINTIVSSLIDMAVAEKIIARRPEPPEIEFAAFAALNYLTHSVPNHSSLFGNVYTAEEIKQLCYNMLVAMLK